MTLRLGWLSTGRDEAARELLTAVQQKISAGTIPARLTYVFCNREEGESALTDRFLDYVRELNLPLHTFSSARFQPEKRKNPATVSTWREAFDLEVLKRIGKLDADIIVMAGYMLILSGHFCRSLNLINLHPAVPGGPTGTWQEVMWQLMESRSEFAGAMMHLVIEELDRGPAMSYFSFSLRSPQFLPLWRAWEDKRRRCSLAEIRAAEGENEPLFALMRAEELKREFPLLVHTLKSLAEGRLTLQKGQVFVSGKPAPSGEDLSQWVEAEIKS